VDGRAAMTRRLPYLDHALLYDAHGLRVFPLARLVRDDDGRRCSCPRGAECSDPGKHPLQSGWRDALVNIGRWWGLGGAWNVGIETGAVSGIVVLDIDPRHGGDQTLAELEDHHGALPATWRFLTGGGGQHILFRHPGGYIKSRPGALGSGLDCKADGGLIVAPPSLHLSGNRYRIAEGHHPNRAPLARLPDWLHALLTAERQRQRRREKPVRPCRGLSRYGEVALDNACRRILDAGNGQQETTLNREAYGIGRLVGAGALPADFALQALQFAVQRIATFDSSRPWRDLSQKVERSFADGVGNPRSVRR
jgi:Bifunctional DNA primase/polymerase, N-terminal